VVVALIAQIVTGGVRLILGQIQSVGTVQTLPWLNCVVVANIAFTNHHPPHHPHDRNYKQKMYPSRTRLVRTVCDSDGIHLTNDTKRNKQYMMMDDVDTNIIYFI